MALSVASSLLVELARQFGKACARVAFSCGLFEQKPDCVKDERHEHPAECESGPVGVVHQQVQKGDEVCDDISCRQCYVEKEKPKERHRHHPDSGFLNNYMHY